MAIDYSDVASKASGIFVGRGFGRLGPVRDFGSPLLLAGNADFGAQLAAEQISHFVDGWRYFASAMSAFLNNSKGGAVHFSYYAELRAAMSLLAYSGIRVRQGELWYLNVHGHKIDIDNGRTHTAAWKFWDNWVGRSDATGLFRSKVRVSANVNLGHVADAVSFFDSTMQLGGWGADLIALSGDHDSRNTASYETSIVERSLSRAGGSERDLIAGLWKLMRKSAPGCEFDVMLARYLVKCSIDSVCSAETIDDEKVSADDHFNKIANKISAATGERPGVVSDYLRPDDGDDFSVFELASSVDVAAENVLCRAFCLLRVSMLALDASLTASGKPDAADWIKNWLDHAGIWSADLECDPVDINEDYRIALDDFISESFSGALWNARNLQSVMRVTRPDACLAWNLSL